MYCCVSVCLRNLFEWTAAFRLLLDECVCYRYLFASSLEHDCQSKDKQKSFAQSRRHQQNICFDLKMHSFRVSSKNIWIANCNRFAVCSDNKICGRRTFEILGLHFSDVTLVITWWWISEQVFAWSVHNPTLHWGPCHHRGLVRHRVVLLGWGYMMLGCALPC